MKEGLRLLAPWVAPTLIIWLFCGAYSAAELPPVPVGLDSYRMWERWPYQRIGVRAYMRSTYDRAGGNEGADASHFLYQQADDFSAALDVEGRGVLYFARFNRWHGSPWHFEIDDKDNLVSESSTADPTHPAANSFFIPPSQFPAGLTWTWSTTKGADLTWVPIDFERRLRLGYSRTHYGTGYYIYALYAEGTLLSQPIHSRDENKPAEKVYDVVELIDRSGTDIAPHSGVSRESGEETLPAAGSMVLLDTRKAPAMLRAIEISVPRTYAIAFERVRLQATWDDRSKPSIDAPVALFYGTGSLFNRDNREYLVKGFPVSVRFARDRVFLSCYFPMPFFRSARIELVTDGPTIPGVRWEVRCEPYRGLRAQVAYFHATYGDHLRPQPGRDLVLLDTRDVEGGGDWSGSFVGTSFIFSHAADLATLEGDPRFFFDDSETPQGQGTGSEEWAGGGDYWGGENVSLPFAGHPVGAPNPQQALNYEDQIESAYRFLLADLMPFGRRAVIHLEHGGTNQSTEHYETITYWYGAPYAILVPTDRLQIGDLQSEREHSYFSPDASRPYEITSRYEWGPDHVGAVEIFPPVLDHGRTTKGTSEFTLRLDPNNYGVLLRRKLDYAFPDQRAEVTIDGKPAGIWYLAGSTVSVYSNPPGELGSTQHLVRISNRRFRDDEFLVPSALTHGRAKVQVRVKFAPHRRPLFPGRPISESAWSEIRYDAYCYILPH